MKKAMVVLNENHGLFPEQFDLLDSNFGCGGWGILPVPTDGWNLEEISNLTVSLRQEGCCHLAVASPIPALMANARDEEKPVVWAFHNDQRISKEVPDGKGGVRLIKTVSSIGWKLIC